MNSADLKPSLIDLEAGSTATGRKQDNAVQRERLSERDTMYYVYWIHYKDHTDIYTQGYVGITCNFKERMRQHKKNKKKTPLTMAIQKYSWRGLNKLVILEAITLEKALETELHYRPTERIGWNLQKGGNIGVDSSWYDLNDNKEAHSIATSIGTIAGIKEKDTTKERSARAKNNWITHKDSYKDIAKGSKNPKAKLNEWQVYKIKYELIPSGMKNKEIADLYSVKQHVISFIRKGKTWKHV